MGSDGEWTNVKKFVSLKKKPFFSFLVHSVAATTRVSFSDDGLRLREWRTDRVVSE
jgi:hypothetical protein